MDLDGMSQVSLYGTGASSCGYCSSSSRSSRISYGIDSQYITAADYQILIDRGWRRSGTYIYLPDNKLSCCPNWTIRLHVPDFKPTRRHRKIKNRFEHYVNFGRRTADTSSTDNIPSHDSPDSAELAFTEIQSYLRCAVDEALKSIGDASSPSYTIKLAKSDLICNVALVVASGRRKQGRSITPPSALAQELCSHLQTFALRDGDHPIRITNDGNGFLHFCSASFQRLRMPSATKARPAPKSKPVRTPFTKFSARLVPASFSKEAFDIYRLYQVAVHKDNIDRLTEGQYRNFLCDSPIVTEPSAEPNLSYGSFHLQYRFNEKLIGVSVIDILPKCVSSVYFFYDPDFAFLSLGIWSALYELSLVPSSSLVPDLRYYYLGYYVHGCPKMRYKKQFSPTQLLCSEKLSWHPLEKCLAALDHQKYVAFSAISDPISLPDPEADVVASVDDIQFLLSGQSFRFRDLKPVARARLLGLVQEYFDKIGPALATKRFVVTNIFVSIQ